MERMFWRAEEKLEKRVWRERLGRADSKEK
jgi:hypothetical protein